MKFFKKSDIWIILFFALISIGTWIGYDFFLSKDTTKAEIYYYSELIETINLTPGRERAFNIPQNKNVILKVDQDASICFEESNCPDKICVHTGKISRVGEYAACIPNGVMIKIVPTKHYSKDNLDIVVGQ